VKLVKIYILFFLCQQISFAQNLVQDSSFEINKFIPVDFSAIASSGSWSSPSRGTTDLFCKCTNKKIKHSPVNVPNNSMGVQEARSGNCYAGLFAVSHGFYREYLQTQLMSSLVKGKNYIFSMYVSVADYAPLTIDKLGVCFLNGKVNYAHSDAITNLNPVYISLESEVGIETTQWHQLTFTYKAKGGESCLLIGGFDIRKLTSTGNFPPKEVVTPIYKRAERDAYYFIDDVSLFEEKIIIDTDTIPRPFPTSKDTAEIVVVKADTNQNTNAIKAVVFKNVLFESAKSVLSPVSFPELNALADILAVEPNTKIEIYGHTDNAGDEKVNLDLSNNRAKAVSDYLVSRGIDPGRINHKGFGSIKPIASNETEEGRKLNRRVEFLLIK